MGEESLAVGVGHAGAVDQGAGEGDLVGELQVGPYGDAARDAGDLYLCVADLFGDVESGGIALDVGTKGKDDFLNAAGPNPAEQAFDVEHGWPDALQRIDQAIEDVV